MLSTNIMKPKFMPLVRNFVPLIRIDRYYILTVLGSGSFGSVFRAYDSVAEIDVAIKLLPAQIAHREKAVESTRQNFRIVSKLHHPNIASPLVLHRVEQIEYGILTNSDSRFSIAPGDLLLVMELAEGLDLATWYHNYANISVQVAARIMSQIAFAIDYAHSEGVLHRDIKPSNIMVHQLGDPKCPIEDAEFQVKVLDFGLAAEIEQSINQGEKHAGTICGTRRYMSPEQWRGERLTAASDVYSLAVIAYELLHKEVPFASAFDTYDVQLMYTTVMNADPEFDKWDHARLRAVMQKGLAKDPKDRYATCGEFVSAFVSVMLPNREEERQLFLIRAQEAEDSGNEQKATLLRAAAENYMMTHSVFTMRLQNNEQFIDDRMSYVLISEKERSFFWRFFWHTLVIQGKHGVDGLKPLLECSFANDAPVKMEGPIGEVVSKLSKYFGAIRTKIVLKAFIVINPTVRGMLAAFNKECPEDIGEVEQSFCSYVKMDCVRKFVCTYIGVAELNKKMDMGGQCPFRRETTR